MPIPLDSRKKPVDVKVRVAEGRGLDIVWADGHSSHYDFAYLREQCPCAMCDDERRKRQEHGGHSSGSAVSTPDSNPLQLYKPKPGARSAKAVGNYALQIEFNDGHNTGIYSYDYLRAICPCADCAALFRRSSDDS